jgi:hypothetical protein
MCACVARLHVIVCLCVYAPLRVSSCAFVCVWQVPRRPVGPRVDVWALGCSVYRMAFGCTPFEDAAGNPLKMGILGGRCVCVVLRVSVWCVCVCVHDCVCGCVCACTRVCGCV